MNVLLVLLGIAVAAITIPKVFNVANKKWFSNIEAMDEDYPRRGGDTSWGAGGGHLGQ